MFGTAALCYDALLRALCINRLTYLLTYTSPCLATSLDVGLKCSRSSYLRLQSASAAAVVAGGRRSTPPAKPSRSQSTFGSRTAFGTLPSRPHATSCRCRASTSPTRNLLAHASRGLGCFRRFSFVGIFDEFSTTADY